MISVNRKDKVGEKEEGNVNVFGTFFLRKYIIF